MKLQGTPNTYKRFIFTHNNADFDAVAALFGTYRLDTAALPVLPKQVRQNVRNFLTLYAPLFPSIRYDDLPDDQSFEHIYLVDTQIYHSYPFINKHTPVHIIDHHPRRHDLPKHFTSKIDEVGATSTLLVEMMDHQGIGLAPLEATLLMLGIYEDSGSLTYGTTTVRDIRAAAWLMNQGADLDILREFLSYPLQDEQWQIYDQLRNNIEIATFGGHTVLIATATFERQVEGVSRIAHQLMNLYDTNALAILVKMGKDVQLVGRSEIDEIDIGQVARTLGGGGHSRAAAANMRSTTLETAHQMLVEALPKAISPSTTVADLMSSGRIETITASDTIAQAAQLMQISGHEGYPVLDQGRVVGLLTRRAVDRAMNHQLGNQLVQQVMEVGPEIYVHPQDSLDILRQKMMDTGWGQIPVLGDDGAMIGIVTRTDLIRRWGEPPQRVSHHHRIISSLQRMLPTGLWALLERIATHAQEAKLDLYLVGGLVRDLLLGRPNLDIDLVVEGDAIALVKGLQARYGGDIRTHTQFGTAKWLLDEQVAEALGIDYGNDWPRFLDFATARAEFYKEPTVLPTVRQSSIKQDLHRRDFTINSMAVRLSPGPMGMLIDYYNGERDLNLRLIRVLHSLSFVDDPTRMLRAVRFEQRFHFCIEDRTKKLLTEALPFLDRVTGERLKHELLHLLVEANPLASFRRLYDLGILQAVFPSMQIDAWFRGAFSALQYARQQDLWQGLDIEARLAGIALLVLRCSEAQIDAFARRLLLSRSSADTIQATRRAYLFFLSEGGSQKPSVLSAYLRATNASGWITLWAALPTAALRRHVEDFVQIWRHLDTEVDGHQLAAMGVPKGPMMGDILKALRNAWIDGDITDRASEAHFLTELLKTRNES